MTSIVRHERRPRRGARWRRRALAAATAGLVALPLAPAAAAAQRDSIPSVARPAAGASIDRRAYAYSRALPDGPTGLVALQLDAAALAHASLDGVRLATADGHEVPYVAEHRGDSLVLALAPPARLVHDTTAGVSHYRLALPYAGLPASRLVLGTSARVFEREVGIGVPAAAGDPPPRTGDGAREMLRARWRGDTADSAAADLVLSLPPLRAAELRVTVDEGSNAPLPLARAALLLPDWRLRFYRQAGVPVTLLYGRAGSAAPRYDLALLAPRILAAPAVAIAAGAEAARPVTSITPTVVFWCALAVAVAALAFILARLVRAS